jgi:coenzyme F420-reducing hydrogenase beta subunit
MTTDISPKNIIDSGLCIGCGICVGLFDNGEASMQFDKNGFLKPSGKNFLRKNTEIFKRTCPFSPLAMNETQLAEMFNTGQHNDDHVGRYQNCYVGYAAQDDFRLNGSSGGMVTWVATELMRKGLIDGVAHVVAVDDPQQEGKYFKYRISRTEAEVRQGAKSRYYPIEMSEILKIIRDVPGRYAVVGIPCFIKAVQLLRSENALYKERIAFMLGLFCGHMKSARFIESFAWQMNVAATEVKKVEYRYKDPGRPANWYNARLELHDGSAVNRDWWHLADGDWGAGYFMNAACNYCDDVVAETADISFGDAWVEPYSSDGRGTNVVVVRSAVVDRLLQVAIDEGRLQLEKVDPDFVMQTQAAGFRQRREGLAYRLTWRKRGIKPVKRVAPAIPDSRQRRLIYRIRYLVSEWSHKMFWLAKKLNKPQLYIGWAKAASSVYHGLAYQRGKLGTLIKKITKTEE